MFFSRPFFLIQLTKLLNELDILLLKTCQLAKAKDIKSRDINNFV